MSDHNSELPAIMVTTDDLRHLKLLASSCTTRFPRVAHFLACELARANVVPARPALEGVVRMNSQVRCRDGKTGRIRELTLVYPHQADIDLNPISVLSPVGAALSGLSAGQTIDFKTRLAKSTR